jgi:hypothetical protein
MRIALIHALTHSIAPIEASFREHWPETERAHLLDASLSADRARDGRLTPAMIARFHTLARYAHGCGAAAILFTCSAFGPAIESVAASLAPVPVLKPNEAMIAEAIGVACALAGTAPPRIGLLASFPATLDSMPAEFAAVDPAPAIRPCLAPGALAALDAGDGGRHDELAAEAARALADCHVIVLAQFSLARAARAVAATTGRPVLTTPDSAVRQLRARLALVAAD